MRTPEQVEPSVADDVGTDGGILNSVAHHNADGFVLACSTVPSSTLATRLEAITSNRGVPTMAWDGVQLERMLTSPRGWAMAQRFMPSSAEATGWRVVRDGVPEPIRRSHSFLWVQLSAGRYALLGLAVQPVAADGHGGSAFANRALSRTDPALCRRGGHRFGSGPVLVYVR